MFLFIILLCVLTALELSTQDCTLNHHPSLYEQYCCVEDNHGKTFILSENEDKIRFQYILCPRETPASCSSIDFSPSCSAILTSHPTATSGYYNIMLANGTVITVYCDMEGVNCDGEGGWMRVAYLNMSDRSEQCPPGFGLYEENGIRACGRQSKGCQSVKFPSHNINYNRVCGRVTGYQKGTPDGISYTTIPSAGINDVYLDGLSITRGNPRKHVWTFIASTTETQIFAAESPISLYTGCPCDLNIPANDVLSSFPFIGEEYFCESDADINTFYSDDPLFDGDGCRHHEIPCCNVTGIPWFNKVLEQPTTDYIELRICSNHWPYNEDVPVGHYDIYVK